LGVCFAGDFVIPLFQTNFLPDFMQVNVVPEESDFFRPSCVHFAPALIAEYAGEDNREVLKIETRTNRFTFLMEKGYAMGLDLSASAL